MFRRKDEDEIEYTLQANSNNSATSGFTASNEAPAAKPTAAPSFLNEEQAQPSGVPFIKTSAASAPAVPEVPKLEIPAQAPKAEIPAPKEPAKPAAPKSSAVNTFVPSALRAPASSAPAAPAASAPNFATKSPLKIDNIGLETERRLTVGYGISLEGKVSDCDKLVIYGNVNAELNNVKALQISDSGCFRGEAEVDFAEISGLFEGELKVRKSIVINSTGRVSGKITYGSIEIKPGGKFTGEIVEDKELSKDVADETADENSSSNLGFNLFAGEKSEVAA